jgi:hypothetical protein
MPNKKKKGNKDNGAFSKKEREALTKKKKAVEEKLRKLRIRERIMSGQP